MILYTTYPYKHINTATDLLYALCNKLCEGIINNRHCTPQCYCERGIDQSDNLWSRTRKRQYHPWVFNNGGIPTKWKNFGIFNKYNSYS